MTMQAIRFTITFCLLIVPFLRSGASGQEWTRFRGPNGTGISDAEQIPTKWTERDYNWKVEIPGVGHSQPVTWGERIFLTSATDDGKQRSLLCLRTSDGGTAWSKPYAMATYAKHKDNSYASGSPAVDEDSVYIAFATTEHYWVKALDHEGKGERWQRDLGPFQSMHGHGGSPIVYGDKLILTNDQRGKSSIVALERKTGKTVWEIPRLSGPAAYSTPCIVRREGRADELILASMPHGLSSCDPNTGKLNWEAPVFDKRTVGSPVLFKDLVIATCGSGGGGNYLVAVRLGGEGDVSESHLAYKLTRSIPYVPTPVVLGGRLFLWSDKGIVSCVEAATGKVILQKRVDGRYYSSPICIQGRLFCTSTDGEVVVLKANDELEVLARNAIGEGSHSTPAVAAGRLYLRTFSHLISLGGRELP